jgi:hypothetical protein
VQTAGCPIGFESILSSVPDDMIPMGGIISWSGSVATIPNNYALCDGTCGTPDLRDRFIIGAGDVHAVNDTGGSADLSGDVALSGPIGNTGVNVGSGVITVIDNSLPPYHALCFIQRIS